MDTLLYGVLIACAFRHGWWLTFAQRYWRFLDVLSIVLAGFVAFDFFSWLARDLIQQPATAFLGFLVGSLKFSAISLLFALILLRALTSSGSYVQVLSNPLLRRVGLISYGAYMYHQIVNVVIHGLIHGDDRRLDNWGDAYIPILVMGVTFVVAALSFVILERPIRSLGHRLNWTLAPANKGPTDQKIMMAETRPTA